MTICFSWPSCSSRWMPFAVWTEFLLQNISQNENVLTCDRYSSVWNSLWWSTDNYCGNLLLWNWRTANSARRLLCETSASSSWRTTVVVSRATCASKQRDMWPSSQTCENRSKSCGRSTCNAWRRKSSKQWLLHAPALAHVSGTHFPIIWSCIILGLLACSAWRRWWRWRS